MKYDKMKMTATLELNLEKITEEVRETAKALIEFAEKLEEIDRKYSAESEEKNDIRRSD